MWPLKAKVLVATVGTLQGLRVDSAPVVLYIGYIYIFNYIYIYIHIYIKQAPRELTVPRSYFFVG